MFSLYLYFCGLSLRNTFKALIIFKDQKEVTFLYGIGFRFGSYQIYNKRKRVSAFIIDETVIQVGNQKYWLWFCIEPINSSVLGIYISEDRNMIVAEKFIRSLVSKYGEHTVYTDGGTWYPQACTFLHLKHYLHSPFEKSLMERVNQYFNDRTESFDDYYPCMQNDCNLYYMCITGYISLYQFIMIQYTRITI